MISSRKMETGTEGSWFRSHFTAEAAYSTASSSEILQSLSVGATIFSMTKQ